MQKRIFLPFTLKNTEKPVYASKLLNHEDQIIIFFLKL